MCQKRFELKDEFDEFLIFDKLGSLIFETEPFKTQNISLLLDLKNLNESSVFEIEEIKQEDELYFISFENVHTLVIINNFPSFINLKNLSIKAYNSLRRMILKNCKVNDQSFIKEL